MPQVFIGLGSNMGHRDRYIESAIDFLAGHPRIEVLGHTQTLETAPWGVTNQPPFLNAIALVFTDMAPLSLLTTLQEAEKRIGRTPSSEKWGPREIDLDILLYGDHIIDMENLTVPHRELRNRPFVLRQLLELNEDLRAPDTGRPYRDYL